MDKDELEKRLAYVTGQALGAQIAVRALVLMQPDPDTAMRAVLDQFERFLASGLASESASDAMLLGVSAAKRTVLPSRADIDRLKAS